MTWRSFYSFLILLTFLSFSKVSADTLSKIEAIQNAQVNELPKLWEQHEEGSDFRYLVMTRWIEISPDNFFRNELSWQEFDRGWYIRGRLVGQSADDPIIKHPIVRKMLADRVIPYFFAGLAEVRPEEVMELMKAREELVDKFDQKLISTGVIQGLAQTKPDKAIDVLYTRACFGWIGHNDRLVDGPTNYKVGSLGSHGESLALWRWVVFHPQEALSSISDDEGILFSPDLGATLVLQLPDQVEHLFHDLPTGLRKRVIKEYLDLAREKPDEILKYLKMAPPAEIRNQHDFQSLLKTTSTVLPVSFPASLTDHRFAHLPSEEVELLRSVIKDRWAKIDPKSLLRFQEARDQEDLSAGLKAWWDHDPQEVTSYVTEKKSPIMWGKFISVVALSDAKHALKLYRALPEDMNRRVTNGGDKLLFVIAKDNREAFLEYLIEDEEKKRELLIILAKAWLRDDFDWTVNTLTRHKVNPFESQNAFPGLPWQKIPFDFIQKMPPDWKQSILDSRYHFFRDPFRWLSSKNHPGLSDNELKKIQKHLGINASWISSKDIPWVQHLIDRGDWLSDVTKSGLVEWAAIRARDREGLRAWVESLPPTVNAKALETLDYYLNFEKERKYQPDLSDLKNLSDYLLNPHEQQCFSMRDWTISEIRNFHSEIRKMSSEKAGRLFKSVSIEHLPWRMQVSLIPKVLENPDLVESNYLKFRVRKTAKVYATLQPSRAADWAMALTDENLQALAAGIVADVWKDQNADEAKAWVLTLPKPLQQKFGY